MKAIIKFNGQEKEVELTDEQVKEFGFKESKVWKPKYGEEYYYINDYNEVARSYCGHGDYSADKDLYEIGNCYPTEEQAYFERDCQIYLTKYKRWLEEHNEPIDWTNPNQYKFFACYNKQTNEIKIDITYIVVLQGVLYAASDDIIDDFIEKIGEDNFKKYILRVKED